jgi:hypothetical protein
MDGSLDRGFTEGSEGAIFMISMEFGTLPKKEKVGFTENEANRRFNGMHTSVKHSLQEN